jgi:hypothetical protein
MTRHWKVFASLLLWIGAAVSIHDAMHPPRETLRIDLGAGDEAYAGGFPGGWEAHERRGNATFRWTGESARLDLPVAEIQGKLRLVLRFARFSEGRAYVAVQAGARVESWSQGPSAWRVREMPIDSGLDRWTILFHSTCDESCRPGVALDWIEIRGARSIRPRVKDLFAAVLLFIAVPGLVAAAIRRSEPLLHGSPLILAGCGFVIRADPISGITMLTIAGSRALITVICLVAAWRLVGLRRKPASFDWRALLVPAAFAVLATGALSYPRFHYPDVDTHARFLKAIKSEPRLAIDPTPFQQKTRAWTRFIANHRVGFPYSSVFHVLAWPWAWAFGDVGAVKTTVVLAVALSILLVHALALKLGAGRRQAILAQCVFALLPVTASRMSLALYPSLLGQTLDIVALLLLIAGLERVVSWRGAALAGLALAVCQTAYTGSLVNVGVIVVCLAPLEIAAGARLRMMRLAAAYLVFTALIVVIQYHYFLPTFWHDILPNIGDAAASPDPGVAPRQGGALAFAIVRLAIFYGALAPMLALIGLLELRRAQRSARHVTAAVLVAGGLLAWLRFALPAVFQDAKEVELLAAPSSALIALGIGRLWRGRIASRILALAGAAGLFTWAAWRAVSYYVVRIN